MKKQFYDLTPRMVQDFFQNVDAYLECNCEHKLADLLMEMNVFEKQIIKGLYDRAYKEDPFKTMCLMERILDVKRTKIKGIVHKK